jgi:RND family efflux transporter MFP subunit
MGGVVAQRASTVLCCLLIPAYLAAVARGQATTFGYTRAYRTAELAAAEPEVISEILVKEGQAVTQGQVLAKLDCSVLSADLAAAKAAAQATGRMEAAKAELALQQLRLKRLSDVQDKANIREDELTRVKADVEIAKANLQSAAEAMELKQAEVKKIEAQIERRILRSPFDGVVTEVHREVGESTIGANNTVFTLVQLDQLKATIHLAEGEARGLTVGAVVSLVVGDEALSVPGKVLCVFPVNDPASNTVRVDFVIDNGSGSLRSGKKVMLAAGKAVPPASRPASAGKSEK